MLFILLVIIGCDCD
ncbi:sporulation protein YjcZ [Brevibacillus nitrificans]|nr:sporulation protein YjcZ [Brevibacillus nitrificans]